MTSKHFCLKWTKFHTSILNAFESLQNTEDLADVTLSCEGTSLKAHKFILSACSPYFRAIFKENPCPHPIVILKDVACIDLIAIINFMYHGEVMVTEEQLPSFLQTATTLQVSGLINDDSSSLNKDSMPIKKSKKVQQDSQESPVKKVKISSKVELPSVDGSVFKINPANCDPVNIKIEKNELVEEFSSQNENESKISLESEPQRSVLESALEIKTGSILERSLTSDYSNTKLDQKSCDNSKVLQLIPDNLISKMLFIPRKPPECEMFLSKNSSDSSSSPCGPEHSNEYPYQIVRSEGIEIPEIEDSSIENTGLRLSKTIIDTPHHSSQCGNCPHCGKAYSSLSSLKYHVRLVHSDLTNMYCCHLCPESFDYREGYKKHMVEVHSIKN